MITSIDEARSALLQVGRFAQGISQDERNLIGDMIPALEASLKGEITDRNVALDCLKHGRKLPPEPLLPKTETRTETHTNA